MDGTRRRLIGLGLDLQLISELAVAQALLEPNVFFTARELRRFASTVVPMASMAGGFAAKEALFKALPADGTWFWTDAELVHDHHGAPRFRVHGSLASHLARRRLRVSVSISHSGGFASAVVVVTGGISAAARFLSAISWAVRHVHQRITARAARAPQ